MNRKVHISECCFCVAEAASTPTEPWLLACLIDWSGMHLVRTLDGGNSRGAWQATNLLGQPESDSNLPATGSSHVDFSYELARSSSNPPQSVCSERSQNSLLGQVSLVLALYSDLLKVAEFLLLDALDLETLVLDALPHLLALLEVVKALLLLDLGVHLDLVAANRCTRGHPPSQTTL